MQFVIRFWAVASKRTRCAVSLFWLSLVTQFLQAHAQHLVFDILTGVPNYPHDKPEALR